MIDRIMKSPWVYRAISLVCALILFAYVNADTLTSTLSPTKDTELLANKTETLKMPLQINANTDKYYITGYPEKVAVTLDGPSAIVTAAYNTQNFKVIADLTKYGVGEHTVKLKISGLNSDITATVKPKTVKVKIQNKTVKKFPIQVKFNKDSIASGYSTGTPTLSADTVEVTGASSQISKIDQIIATVSLKKNTKSNIDQEVLLEAVDANNNPVSAVINPQTVRVQIPVTLPTKKVPLSLEQTGDAVSGYKYSLSSDTEKVTVQAPQSTLDSISQISLNIDVSGITSSETRTVTINLDNDDVKTVTPTSVKVTISATKSSSTTSDSSSSATASSDSTSSKASSSSSKESESSSSSSSADESDESVEK